MVRFRRDLRSDQVDSVSAMESTDSSRDGEAMRVKANLAVSETRWIWYKKLDEKKVSGGQTSSCVSTLPAAGYSVPSHTAGGR